MKKTLFVFFTFIFATMSFAQEDNNQKLISDFVFVEDNEKTSAFYICNHEVTQKEWQDVMGKNPSVYKGINRPVEKVSWNDMIKYCNKRSKKEGLTPCYTGSGASTKCDFSANGYRLPTEAEWRYAAKGGNKSNNYKYSGSDDINEVAWYYENSGEETHDVKQKNPNELGLYDMSGNVVELCWDLYEYNPKEIKDYTGPTSGNNRVSCGGSMCDYPDSCEVAFRDLTDPAYSYDFIGFRLVHSK